MIKVFHKLLSVLTSVLGGKLAGAIVKRTWKLTSGDDQPPKATDRRRGWREVLLAAALQGAVFAVVKAAVERGTAHGTHKLTGTWPGDSGEQAD